MRHLPHLYLPRPWEGPILSLSDGHRHHLRRVLRVGEGDPVSYTDGRGVTGWGRLDEDAVVRGNESERARPSTLTVAVAPPTSRDRIRFLVEKLAEMGVARLLWVRTRQTEGRPPPDSKSYAWATAALEQSRGAWLMEIDRAALEELDRARLVVADPAGGDPPQGENLILLVGPEGGLEPGEVPGEVQRVSLATTILRVETAAMIGAALLRRRRSRSG